MNRTRLLLTLLLGAPFPLAAQSRDGSLTIDDMHRVRPTSCALADSLTGRALGRPKRDAFAWRAQEVNNFMSGDPFAITATRPLDGLILTAMSPDSTPNPTADFGLQIRMKDSVLRTGAAARLMLTMDDSTTLDLGEMSSSATPFGYGGKIDQMLTVGFNDRAVRRLIGATTVTGTIGGTAFTIPERTLEMFRSAYIAATCGTRLR